MVNEKRKNIVGAFPRLVCSIRSEQTHCDASFLFIEQKLSTFDPLSSFDLVSLQRLGFRGFLNNDGAVAHNVKSFGGALSIRTSLGGQSGALISGN
jgi:hypothetical protein